MLSFWQFHNDMYINLGSAKTTQVSQVIYSRVFSSQFFKTLHFKNDIKKRKALQIQFKKYYSMLKKKTSVKTVEDNLGYKQN